MEWAEGLCETGMDKSGRLIQNTGFSLSLSFKNSRETNPYSLICQVLALGDREAGLEFLPITHVVISSATVLDLWQASQVSESQIRIGFMRQGPIYVVWH